PLRPRTGSHPGTPARPGVPEKRAARAGPCSRAGRRPGVAGARRGRAAAAQPLADPGEEVLRVERLGDDLVDAAGAGAGVLGRVREDRDGEDREARVAGPE